MLTKVNENELRVVNQFLVINGVRTDVTPNPVEYLLLKEYDLKDEDIDAPMRRWDWLTFRFPNPSDVQYRMIENGVYQCADGSCHSIRTDILNYLGSLLKISPTESPEGTRVMNPGESHIICYKNNKYSKDMTVFSFITLILSQDTVAAESCDLDPELLKDLMYQFGYSDEDMERILMEDNVYEAE